MSTNNSINLAKDLIAQKSDIQLSSYVYAVDSSITAGDIQITLSPAPTVLEGINVYVKVANTSPTVITTLTINGTGPINIRYPDGSFVVGYTLLAGCVAQFFYDGTNAQLISVSSPATDKYSTYYAQAFDNGGGSGNDYVALLNSTSIIPAIGNGSKGIIYFNALTNNTSGPASLTLQDGTNTIGPIPIYTQGNNNAVLSPDAIVAGAAAIISYNYGGGGVLLNPQMSAYFQSNYYTSSTDSGAADHYAVTLFQGFTLSSTPGAFFGFYMIAANANTGACDIAVNGGAPVAIKVNGGSDPVAGAILANGVYQFINNGTNYILMNPSA